MLVVNRPMVYALIKLSHGKGRMTGARAHIPRD